MPEKAAEIKGGKRGSVLFQHGREGNHQAMNTVRIMDSSRRLKNKPADFALDHPKIRQKISISHSYDWYYTEVKLLESFR